MRRSPLRTWLRKERHMEHLLWLTAHPFPEPPDPKKWRCVGVTETTAWYVERDPPDGDWLIGSRL